MKNIESRDFEKEMQDDLQISNRKAFFEISQKCLLTLEEASLFTGIGQGKLREISNNDDCKFVLWNGSKRMFKKEMLKEYLYNAYSI